MQSVVFGIIKMVSKMLNVACCIFHVSTDQSCHFFIECFYYESNVSFRRI